MNITVQPGCKINLYLRITGRRADGYHTLKTLFYPLKDPSDQLTVRAGRPGQGLRLVCDAPDIPPDQNILSRAYDLFGAATAWRPDITVELDKSVPIGAGLGGGSADAAAFLRILNDLAGKRALTQDHLAAMALRLGADVPFFLYGRPAWASGLGEKLAPAQVDLSGFALVLAMPAISVSTAWAYAAWDDLSDDFLPETCPNPHIFLTDSLENHIEKNLHGPGPDQVRGLCLVNCLERAVFPNYPALRLLKERFLRQGAAGALMTGSGSAIFALFRDRARAEKTSAALGLDGCRNVLMDI